MFIVGAHKHGKQLEDAIMGLGEQLSELQNIQQLQQQMQQMQQQLEQTQQQGQQQVAEIQKQAGQQIDQLNKELSKFSNRDEDRKDQEVSIKRGTSIAKAYKDMQDADAQEIENRLLGPSLVADIQKVKVETDHIEHESHG